MNTTPPEHEMGRVSNNTALPGGYSLLRLHLPHLSQTITSGQQLRIEGWVLPAMRCPHNQQWVELLARTPLPWSTGDTLQVEVVGKPFTLPNAPITALLIGDSLGLAAMTFLAEQLKQTRSHSLLVLLGFNDTLPFRPAPSRIMVDGLPAGVIATMPLLEDWSVPGRIAHIDEPPGCFGGDVLTLARHWLEQPQLGTVEIYISATQTTCEAGVRLAKQFNLRCQAAVVSD